MLSERIKSETKQAHQALEKQLIPYIKNIGNKEAYIKLLATFYSYIKPIEDEMDKYLSGSIIPRYSERRSSEALLADMQTISKSPVQEPKTCRCIPTIQNEAQALGAMYVLEGSTLGGKIITKMLQDKLNFKDTSAITFFSSYGDDIETMWRSFVQTLNEYTDDITVKDTIIATANETFTHFRNLIAETLNPSYAA